MKIFISWSGDRSHAVAQALYIWLPDVIQSLEPWLSSADIEAGARWETDIARQLDESTFGIICLTPENTKAPWILFEAGALSKSLHNARVCPVLLDLEPSEIQQPLAQFNAVRLKKNDVLRLVQAINALLGPQGLSETRLLNSFERCWSDLDSRIRDIGKQVGQGASQKDQPRTSDDILNEILELVRRLSRSDNARNPLEFLNRLTAEPQPERVRPRRKKQPPEAPVEDVLPQGLEPSELALLKSAGRELEGLSVTIQADAADDGDLLLPISRTTISDELAALGHNVSPRQVELDRPISGLGVYTVPIRLHPEYRPEIKVWVIATG